MPLLLPRVFAINATLRKNPIQQVAESPQRIEGTLATFSRDRLRGSLFTANGIGTELLILNAKPRELPTGYPRILISEEPALDGADLSNGTWLQHPSHLVPQRLDYGREIQKTLDSWPNGFSYVQEDPTRDLIGLRMPQIGALHAIQAHWSVSDSPATIVMPTGTGKTETMLSVLVSARCSKLLVIVPTDALRTQLAEKFISLGILKDPRCRVLAPHVKHPIVCTLKHKPRSIAEMDELFGQAQIIVTTSSIAAQCDATIQERMAQVCPYLFIDEAHHIEAPTWSAFKNRFKAQRILQFTATPFREDGRPLDGKIIYKYPLKKAQEEGYFKPIRFKRVVQFNRKRADQAIAEQAVDQLRADASRGHILMARVESVARAKEVFELYRSYSEFNPVELHTGIKQTAREAARKQVISGQSRIVICVDMLGEGFDLPELKIAAFHDIRKSLSVTLQLAGRFTRSRPDLGDATFIANTADITVQDELRKLYTRDPDWNILLPELSEQMIGEQASLQDFLQGFTTFVEEIPLKTVTPATSTVVYRMPGDRWMPENFRAGLPALSACERIYDTINQQERTLIIVTARRLQPNWTNVEGLFSWDWELYVVVWSPEQKLLFINSSTNAGEYKALAEAIGGPEVSLIRGNDVFRTFAGVNRLRLQNVGLTQQLGRNVRYTGRMGADVEPVLSEAQRRGTLKSVLSGSGFENGETASVGASRKGRIWSHRRGHIHELVAWCKGVGTKILDASIDPNEVLKGTLEAKTILERPVTMPVGVDWPEEIYASSEALWSIVIDDREYSISELTLELASPNIASSLRIAITADEEAIEFELKLFQNDEVPNYRFEQRGERHVLIRRGTRTGGRSIVDCFYDNPPVIWFADGSSLEGNQHVPLKVDYAPYDADKIQAWDWTGVNLRKESQGIDKAPDSVQARVIRELMTRSYDLIFDDDSSGEAADVIAARVEGSIASPLRIEVELYHCKFAHGDTAGQRIIDLYEVCGQAQKCIHWAASPAKRTDLFTHLLRREERRQETTASSRYERGTGELLQTIREISHLCPVLLRVFIVQPGLSKANATRDQLELLSVTENHLLETYQLPFGVIASA